MAKIAITAASGQLGRVVIAKLQEKIPTSDIVAIVRNIEKAKDIGVELRYGDYNDQDGFEVALQGIDKLYLISSDAIGSRATQHKNVIEAAKKSGVKHIVYTSLINADISSLNLAEEHLQTEEDIKQSGITYTILRNGWYTENYTQTIPSILANQTIYGSTENGKISSASRADYAEAAAVVLTNAGHENKTYELAGDTAYTLQQFATEISEQTGKQIKYICLPEADYAYVLSQTGLPTPIAEMIAHWDIDIQNGALFRQDNTLSKLLGRATTSLKESVKIALNNLS